jgi:hypothetical protein
MAITIAAEADTSHYPPLHSLMKETLFEPEGDGRDPDLASLPVALATRRAARRRR